MTRAPLPTQTHTYPLRVSRWQQLGMSWSDQRRTPQGLLTPGFLEATKTAAPPARKPKHVPSPPTPLRRKKGDQQNPTICLKFYPPYELYIPSIPNTPRDRSEGALYGYILFPLCPSPQDTGGQGVSEGLSLIRLAPPPSIDRPSPKKICKCFREYR